jgi:3-methyladenine DNA glycosylase AlkD
MIAKLIKRELKLLSNPKRSEVSKRFFKTGKGEYGERDIFLGISVPDTRRVAKQCIDITLPEIKKLLYSKIHEERLIALIILVNAFNKASFPKQKVIFDFYIEHTKQINNWDLVDISAPNIVGKYLLNKPRKILYTLAKSKNLWEKRIAIIATLTFIRNGEYGDTLKISKILLKDKHDLIHKAVGWMLREVGKKSLEDEDVFLKKNHKDLPRTTLRYAIEKFSKEKRYAYLKNTI